jgi:hypothetical protein
MLTLTIPGFPGVARNLDGAIAASTGAENLRESKKVASYTKLAVKLGIILRQSR